MAVNRFSTPAQAAKFDPTGLDNLLKVRHLQQAREDTTLAETREWLADMYNTTHTDSDSEKVNAARAQYETELESLAEGIRKDGINRGAVNKLLDFKTRYDKEMSASGIFGGAQQYRELEEQEKARFYDFGLKQGYSKDRIDTLWGERTQGRSAFGENGVVNREYEGIKLASKIDPQKLFADMKVGQTIGPDGLYNVESNREQVGAAITSIYGKFATPGTEEHQSMLDQGLTLEDVKRQLVTAGASRIIEKVDDSKLFQYNMETMRQDFRLMLEGYKAAVKGGKAPEDLPPALQDPFVQGPQVNVTGGQKVPATLQEAKAHIEQSSDINNQGSVIVNTMGVTLPERMQPGPQTPEQMAAQREYTRSVVHRIEEFYEKRDPVAQAQYEAKYSGTPEEEAFYDTVDAFVPALGEPMPGVGELELYKAAKVAWPNISNEDIKAKVDTYVADRERHANRALQSYQQDGKNLERTISYSLLPVPGEADTARNRQITRANKSATQLLLDKDAYNITQAIVGEDVITSKRDLQEYKTLIQTVDPEKIRVIGTEATEDYPPSIRYIIPVPGQDEPVIIDASITAPLTNDNDNQFTAAGNIFNELRKVSPAGTALYDNAIGYQRYRDYIPHYGNNVTDYAQSDTLKSFIQEPAVNGIVGNSEVELYKDSSDGKFKLSYREKNDVLGISKKLTWDKLINSWAADKDEITTEDVVNYFSRGGNKQLIKAALEHIAVTDRDVRELLKQTQGDLATVTDVLQQTGRLGEVFQKLRQDPSIVSVDTKSKYMRILEGR